MSRDLEPNRSKKREARRLASQSATAGAQEDPERRLLNLGTLALVLGPEHPGVLTVGKAGRLRRAALVEVDQAIDAALLTEVQSLPHVVRVNALSF